MFGFDFLGVWISVYNRKKSIYKQLKSRSKRALFFAQEPRKRPFILETPTEELRALGIRETWSAICSCFPKKLANTKNVDHLIIQDGYFKPTKIDRWVVLWHAMFK